MHEQRCRSLERTSSQRKQELKSSIGDKEARTIVNQSRVVRSRDYRLHVNA